jgi:PKD repeat protein
MRTLKWMTIFASLALFCQAVQAQGQSGRVDIIGDAAVEIADFFEEDRSELYYFIVDKQSKARTQLFFPDLPDAAFKSGAKVRVRGKSRDKGKGINVETIEVIEAAPDPFGAAAPGDGPVAEAPVASARTRKVLTLTVNFLDAVVDTGTANAVTPQIIRDRMFNETKNVQHFYNLASLGTLTIPTDPNGIGKEPVFGSYTINYNYLTANGGTCIASTWADAALDMWEADTVGNPAGETRSDYDNWSIIVPNYRDYSGRACTWGGYAGVGCTQCWAFSADPASILHGVVIHELGHNFGFGHARFDTNNDGVSDCEYCDSSDMMGGSRNWMKFNAVHFNYQGWWDPVSYDIDTVTPSSTEQEFDLLPVDEEDGPWPGLRAVKTARSGSSNYFFSFRQQTGYYNNVTSSYTNGVNIHWGNSSNYSYFYRMLAPGDIFFDATQDLLVWAVGETTVDDGGGNSTDVFTIKLCNSTCSALWPAFNLTASGTYPDTIRLTWVDNTYNEDGWQIDYSTDGTAWSELTTVAADSTSYSHFGLAGGTTLFYRIRAYRGASENSDWSETVSATTPPASGTFGFSIISGDDDTVEYTGPYTGQMYPDWPYLWLGYDSDNSATNDEGLRFQNVAIPQGATINSAYINYVAYGSASGDTSIRFRTENVDNAEPFTTASANLTSRTFVPAFVDWTLPTSWSNGSAHQSPDLASIVQPIVDREGWGGGNSMVFITQGNPDFPAGNHSVRSYNYNPASAPVLQVDFTWTPAGPVAPAASFTYSTYSLDATFTDTSTDSDGNVVGWSWDFGDTNTSTLQHPVHTYATSGTYTVGLTVTDNDGETNNTSQSVTVTEDTEAPVITVLGDDPALVDQFAPYTDAGATATDNLDGDLTGSIGTTGLPVDTSVVGDVTVGYSVFDGSGNEGTASRTVTVVVYVPPVAAPDGLAATPVAIDSIHLNWNDNSSVETGYVIERSPGGAESWVQIGSVGANMGAFNDNADLSDGSIYDYRVKAAGPDNDSAWSTPASVTTFACSASKTYTGG